MKEVTNMLQATIDNETGLCNVTAKGQFANVLTESSTFLTVFIRKYISKYPEFVPDYIGIIKETLDEILEQSDKEFFGDAEITEYTVDGRLVEFLEDKGQSKT